MVYRGMELVLNEVLVEKITMNQWLDTAEVLDQPLLARYKRSTNSNEMACGSPVVSVNIASWSSAIEN